MSDAISSILSQIRAHQSQAGGRMGDAPASNAINPGAISPGGIGASEGLKGPGFSETLNNAIDNVSRAQNQAGQLQQAFEMGDPRADLARVMVAMQQSSVAFRATVEVRNRMVQAYQDVMNMPI
ncbi:flagellar hook-basal body complex protein FliE [Lysobacter sp. H21R4]|uniref:flagellar hook-basal body complex protein FliE n=1 Tax=Lysobacter sp. H21R4 TaxID=2781021 RepID=UPI00188929AD|nr:flagellar hook-basal body complex protein FliE [Lysobacter sp. H21R4]QOY63336.1 flagellar hook-basal body complex protein FliE [Lysobacter sp. H21R4]